MEECLPQEHAWQQHQRHQTSLHQRCLAPLFPLHQETDSSSSDLEPTFRPLHAWKEPYSFYRVQPQFGNQNQQQSGIILEVGELLNTHGIKKHQHKLCCYSRPIYVFRKHSLYSWFQSIKYCGEQTVQKYDKLKKTEMALGILVQMWMFPLRIWVSGGCGAVCGTNGMVGGSDIFWWVVKKDSC